jgi:secreted trypsin-like serine protease
MYNTIMRITLIISLFLFLTSAAYSEQDPNSEVKAKNLRLKITEGFRELPATSNLNLGNKQTAPLVIDSYPLFQSNLRQLNDQQADSRVLGGQFTNRYLDVVGIFPKIPQASLPSQLCSGVLISPNAVVTAAHCACDGVTHYVQFGATISGENQSYEIGDINVFPGISCETYRKVNDIQKTQILIGRDFAVLKLKTEVPQEVAIPRRIADATIFSQWNKVSVRVVGFGFDNNLTYGAKIHADVAVATPRCTPSESPFFGCAPDLELVAQSKDFLTDTCNGDSGGPAYIYDSKSDHFYLHAITSRGLPGQPCGHGGVYELTTSKSALSFLTNHANIKVGRGAR